MASSQVFPLMELPIELRHLVYHFVLFGNHQDSERDQPRREKLVPSLTSLLRVNQAVHSEVRKFFYGKARFVFRDFFSSRELCMDPFAVVKRCCYYNLGGILTEMGISNRRCLRYVEIDMGLCDTEPKWLKRQPPSQPYSSAHDRESTRKESSQSLYHDLDFVWDLLSDSLGPLKIVLKFSPEMLDFTPLYDVTEKVRSRYERVGRKTLARDAAQPLALREYERREQARLRSGDWKVRLERSDGRKVLNGFERLLGIGELHIDVPPGNNLICPEYELSSEKIREASNFLINFVKAGPREKKRARRKLLAYKAYRYDVLNQEQQDLKRTQCVLEEAVQGLKQVSVQLKENRHLLDQARQELNEEGFNEDSDEDPEDDLEDDLEQKSAWDAGTHEVAKT